MTSFLPALFGGRVISDQIRDIITLPTRLGGLGIHDPSKEANFDYEDSKLATANLKQVIINQLPTYVEDKETQATIMKDIRKRKDQRWKERKQSILAGMNKEQRLTLELCSEKKEPQSA